MIYKLDFLVLMLMWCAQCCLSLYCITQKHKALVVAKSCLTLGDRMDCSPPGPSVHGMLQARTLEWVAIPFSRGSSFIE